LPLDISVAADIKMLIDPRNLDGYLWQNNRSSTLDNQKTARDAAMSRIDRTTLMATVRRTMFNMVARNGFLDLA
jgi:hypothetical protein